MKPLHFSLFTLLKGSQTGDIPGEPEFGSPLPPCPDSPNCIRCTQRFPIPPSHLFELAKAALESMNPYESQSNSQSLQIDSVFRIAVFGYKDDLSIMVQPAENNESLLHIRSASRVGNSDLGVNRRRVKRILHRIKKQT